MDYSSQEAHLAAIVAHDEGMIESFIKGQDVHKATAALMSGVPYDEVTVDQRSAAKKITFGLMYGKTEAGYASDEGITIEEAEKKFNDYFKGKPLIKKAIDDSQEFVKQHGYIELPIGGYQRRLDGIYSNSYSEQQKALRQSFNTVIQGSSAYISQLAIIYVNKWLKNSKYNANIMTTVHDSITLSSSWEDAYAVAKGVKYIMEHLPIPEIQVNYNGEVINDFMQASPGFGKSYGFEAEVTPEELASFNSIDGFYDYYYSLKKIEDKVDYKIISEEEASAEIEAIENNKAKYLAE